MTNKNFNLKITTKNQPAKKYEKFEMETFWEIWRQLKIFQIGNAANVFSKNIFYNKYF